MTALELPRLYSLAEAAKRLGVPENSLRTEIRSGALTTTRIGGRSYVTEADLLEMIEKCRSPSSRQDSSSESEKAAQPRGSFSIKERNMRQAAALKTAQALKKPSRPISPASTVLEAARVIPLTTR